MDCSTTAACATSTCAGGSRARRCFLEQHFLRLTFEHCLRSNRVTRDGVRHLAKVLKENPTLEILDLSANRMEDDGAVYLSEAIAWPGCALRE